MRRWMRTLPSAMGSTPASGSSGWLPGSGTAYGSGPSSVQRSGNQVSCPPCRTSLAAYAPFAVIANPVFPTVPPPAAVSMAKAVI